MSEPAPEPKPQKKRSRYPGTRKRGSTWMYSLELGRDPVTKERIQKYVSKDPKTNQPFRTQREAFAARCEAQAQLRAGTYVEPTKQTLAQYLEFWIEQQTPHLRPASVAKYRFVADKWLTPELGAVQLTKLKAPAIQQFVTKLLEAGKSVNTVRQYVDVLDFALKFAVRQELLTRNPCDGVRKPIPPMKAPKGLTLGEARRLLEYVGQLPAGDPLRIAVVLALFAGCRQGETAGVRWTDVDLETGFITIQLQLEEQGSGKGWRLVPTKGRRPGDDPPAPRRMPDILVEELRIHRAAQAEHRLQRDRGQYHDHQFIVARRDGLPYNGGYISEQYRKLAVELGLSVNRYHSLRGTGSSLMLAANVPLPTVSQWLRHRSPAVTAAAYAYVQPDSYEEAAGTLNQLFRESPAEPPGTQSK